MPKVHKKIEGKKMKITHISIQNFLGCKALNISTPAPITLFCGPNGAGKSSIQEAVKMALVGEATRVALKKEYPSLVYKGQESGFAELQMTLDGKPVSSGISLPNGKVRADYHTPDAIKYVVDAQQFSILKPSDRKALLFGILKISASSADVQKKLVGMGFSDEAIQTVLPMLRSGFEAAQEQALTRSRDQKTTWRAITGETYGHLKADTWQADTSAVNIDEIESIKHRLADLDAAIAAANQDLGAIKQPPKAPDASTLAKLKERAGLVPRIQEKLERDQAELNEWNSKIEAAKAQRSPDLLHVLAYGLAQAVLLLESIAGQSIPNAAASALQKYQDIHGTPAHPIGSGDPVEQKQQLLSYQDAAQVMSKSVASGQRDLAEAQAASETLAALEAIPAAPAADPEEVKKIEEKLTAFQKSREESAQKLEQLRQQETQAAQAEDKTKQARAAHTNAQEWARMAEALVSIPGEILARAIDPLNDRLAHSAGTTQWPVVRVDQDMSITMGGRHYNLLSESEQWRADSMLAEAIGHISGVRLLLLDRFDVLDLPGRSRLITWLDSLAKDGDIETAMIFGTLKSLPKLPPTFAAYWVQDGEVAGK